MTLTYMFINSQKTAFVVLFFSLVMKVVIGYNHLMDRATFYTTHFETAIQDKTLTTTI